MNAAIQANGLATLSNDDLSTPAGMGAPRLSVCIPTFNRAQYIGLAIASVLEQAIGLPVEIVVCDNASTDGTQELVRGLMAAHPQLRYERNEVNLGADGNTLRAPSHGRGDYLWILGSDDTITPGSMAMLMQAIAGDEPAVVMGDAVDCDIALKPVGMLKFFDGAARDFDFAVPADVHAFMGAAKMTASLFGFLSSMVFQRALWERLPLSRHSVGTAYPQVFRALDMVFRGPGKLRYLALPIANDRRNNCSYAAEFGMVARHMIDMRMLRLAIDDYFSADLAMRQGFKGLVRRWASGLFAKRTRVGIPAMDEIIEFFEVDDAVLPAIPAWPCSPLVDAARERLQSHAAGRQLLNADGLLHVGYRRQARAEHRPLNANTIGVDEGFSGFDGVHLPFESASQQAVYIGHKAAFRSAWPQALQECVRVLKPGGWLAWSAEGDSPLALLAQAEQALEGLGFILRHAAQGDDGVVDVVLQRSATQSSTAWSGWLEDALAAQQQGDWPRAAQIAHRILAVAPTHATALEVVGAASLNGGRQADAVVAFSAALRQQADSVPSWCNLGCAYAALGGYDEAAACFIQALRRQPAFGAAQSNRLAIEAMPLASRHAARVGFDSTMTRHAEVADARAWLVSQ